MTDDELRKLLDGATEGRRVQFNPGYCREAVGTHPHEWDSSHDTSVILPDGSRLKGYARHKHADDAALDALAPTLAREVLALREAAKGLADAVHAMAYGEGWEDEVQQEEVVISKLATLRTVLGESK
jgi:hypothetical protein